MPRVVCAAVPIDHKNCQKKMPLPLGVAVERAGGWLPCTIGKGGDFRGGDHPRRNLALECILSGNLSEHDKTKRDEGKAKKSDGFAAVPICSHQKGAHRVRDARARGPTC
jgi:hypothetical protein